MKVELPFKMESCCGDVELTLKSRVERKEWDQFY